MHELHSIQRRAAAVVLAALLLVSPVFTAGCSDTPRKPLRVAISPWPGYEYVHLAKERGLFAEEGVDVRLVELESLGDSRAAFENGSVDVFCASLVELLLSHAQGARHPQAFFVVDWSAGADVLLGDDEVRSVGELKGRRIALEAGSLDVIAVWAALRSAGLTLKDVEIVPVPQGGKRDAFERADVHAVQCFPPLSAELAARPGVRPLFDSSRAPGLIADVIVADSSDLSRDSARHAAFVRAVLRAEDWARDHADEANAIMAAREQLSAAEFAASLEGVHMARREEQASLLAPGGLLAQSVANTAFVLESIGMLDARAARGALVTTRALPAGSAR